LKVKQKQQNLSVNLVVDGRIQKQQLKKVGVDALWVLKKAKVANRKQLKKQVVLLTYEPGDNSVCVFKKRVPSSTLFFLYCFVFSKFNVNCTLPTPTT
jgi:uncharacterized membrane protein YcaP (DUF421 family)